MRQRQQFGFTIIETMLFMSVTGLMVVGFLFGASRSINFQRYKDSVNSLQSVLQQQYSDVENTINDHDATWACTAGEVKVDNAATNYPRGQSDCVLLGKLIRTDDGKSLTINNVTGFIPTTSTTPLDDNTIFIKNNSGGGSTLPNGYGVYVSDVNKQTYDISWDASLSKTDGSGLSFSMLIVRSPLSGTIRTFFESQHIADANIEDIISSTESDSKVTICVNSNDLFSGTKMAIGIAAGTVNAGGIEALGEEAQCQ